MKALPFTIQKFVFTDDPALRLAAINRKHPVQIVSVGECPQAEAAIPGYFVMSSAPPNIDEEPEDSEIETQRQKLKTEHHNAVLGIRAIAQHLHNICNQGKEPELIIPVHGYNTSRSSVQNWYKDLFLYANRYDADIASPGTQVLVGYRWPSEQIELQRLGEALAALPPLPRDVLIFGLLCGLVLLVFEFTAFEETAIGFLLALLLAVFLMLGCLMLALVLMRLVVYFRDRYRASNFGVLDLVELLRQIDRELVRLKAEELQLPQGDLNLPDGATPEHFEEEAARFWQQTPQKIKLSFLGHSMGGLVVTHVVRILSDVFDSRSVDQQPKAEVGTVFKLERLLLASPDIPVLTIISSRANFLASSLRRFAESYLFSSEGDVALRIASTAANYIAFPSRTQSRGYRLGNVALAQKRKADSRNRRGIINLTNLDQEFHLGRPLVEAIAHTPDKILDTLFVTSQRLGTRAGESLADLFQQQTKLNPERVTIADFFTFFDCTDYTDVKFSVDTYERTTRPTGLLTRAKKVDRLSSLDHLLLTLDYALGRRNVHGGYFEGDFSQQMIYRILFLGFSGYLKTLDADPTVAFDPHVALSKLHFRCQENGIQGFLSPIRYRVDIQERPLSESIEELLTAISDKSSTET